MSKAPPPVSLVPDGPWAGWLAWSDPVPGTFLETAIGTSYSRGDGTGKAVVMLESRPSHANRLGALHGGFLAGFADHALFAALAAMGRPEQAAAVTVDLNMQYCGAGRLGPPLRADVDLLKETGKLLFLRMTISQEDTLIAAASATVRKAPASK